MEFEFNGEFSAPITTSQKKFPLAFEVTRDTIDKASPVDERKTSGRSRWHRTRQGQTITLPGNRPCGSRGVPCSTTSDGKDRIPHPNSLNAAVAGTTWISTSDAESTKRKGSAVTASMSLIITAWSRTRPSRSRCQTGREVRSIMGPPLDRRAWGRTQAQAPPSWPRTGANGATSPSNGPREARKTGKGRKSPVLGQMGGEAAAFPSPPQLAKGSPYSGQVGQRG